ncbi:hypothetical protein TRVL_03456 [Trypanosoma vivax]|nr:hypothetical protein TRVL_03456 [Trypanosoma vivax]
MYAEHFPVFRKACAVQKRRCHSGCCGFWPLFAVVARRAWLCAFCLVLVIFKTEKINIFLHSRLASPNLFPTTAKIANHLTWDACPILAVWWASLFPSLTGRWPKEGVTQSNHLFSPADIRHAAPEHATHLGAVSGDASRKFAFGTQNAVILRVRGCRAVSQLPASFPHQWRVQLHKGCLYTVSQQLTSAQAQE